MEKPFCGPVPDGTELIETFGVWPNEGARRWALHLARLEASADQLGFACPMHEIDAAVRRIVAKEQPLRVRLTLNMAGDFHLTQTAFTPDDAFWRLSVSEEPLRSGDPWLAVKSTQRALYDRVRAGITAPHEEVIFLNERGEVCEGTISNLFVEDQAGRRLTPALSSGLLPGVLRSEFRAQGWEEAVFRLDDLRAAKRLWIGNSLRGLMRAKLG